MKQTFVSKSVWENYLERAERGVFNDEKPALQEVKYAVADFSKADLAAGLIFAAAMDMQNEEGKLGKEGADEVSRIFEKIMSQCIPSVLSKPKICFPPFGGFYKEIMFGGYINREKMLRLKKVIENGINEYGFFGVFSVTFSWLCENVPENFPDRTNTLYDYDAFVPKKFSKICVLKSCKNLVTSKKLAKKICNALDRIPVEDETHIDKLNYEKTKISVLRCVENEERKLRKEKENAELEKKQLREEAERLSKAKDIFDENDKIGAVSLKEVVLNAGGFTEKLNSAGLVIAGALDLKNKNSLYGTQEIFKLYDLLKCNGSIIGPGINVYGFEKVFSKIFLWLTVAKKDFSRASAVKEWEKMELSKELAAKLCEALDRESPKEESDKDRKDYEKERKRLLKMYN